MTLVSVENGSEAPATTNGLITIIVVVSMRYSVLHSEKVMLVAVGLYHDSSACSKLRLVLLLIRTVAIFATQIIKIN